MLVFFCPRILDYSFIAKHSVFEKYSNHLEIFFSFSLGKINQLLYCSVLLLIFCLWPSTRSRRETYVNQIETNKLRTGIPLLSIFLPTYFSCHIMFSLPKITYVKFEGMRAKHVEYVAHTSIYSKCKKSYTVFLLLEQLGMDGRMRDAKNMEKKLRSQTCIR